MGIVDVSFLNPKLRKSTQDYGFLVDQIDIKKSQLSSDGKLSPGDYDILNEMAREVYGHPGLTPSQRSNIKVKMASFESDKKKTILTDTGDIGRLKREVNDDTSKIVMNFANNPAKFLTAQQAVQRAKIDQLSTTIDQLENAGDDSTSHRNELTLALRDLSDTMYALDEITSGNPSGNFATYITTNSRGEVVDMKIDRVGSQSGYLETNGIYGGLPMYGKINKKEGGKNVFQIGNQTFSASDVVIPGPDGSLKPSVLVATSQQKGKAGMVISESGNTNVDLAQVRTQGALRPGQWAEGSKGFLYQAQPDGSYKKYVGTDKAKLNISDNDIIKIPKNLEDGIISKVSQTVDGTRAPTMPIPTTPGPVAPSPVVSPATGTPEANIPSGRANTGGAPEVRSPQTAQGTASSILGGAKSFLGRLFGGNSSQ